MLSYFTIAKFFEGELALIDKGEIALKSEHIKKTYFNPTDKYFSAHVVPSMKSLIYKVKVKLNFIQESIFNLP